MWTTNPSCFWSRSQNLGDFVTKKIFKTNKRYALNILAEVGAPAYLVGFGGEPICLHSLYVTGNDWTCNASALTTAQRSLSEFVNDSESFGTTKSLVQSQVWIYLFGVLLCWKYVKNMLKELKVLF